MLTCSFAMCDSKAPSSQGGGSSHRILRGIRKQEQQREVERSHLFNLTLATSTYADQHQQLNGGRAQQNFEQHVGAGKERSL
jgi:hypothetical protein